MGIRERKQREKEELREKIIAAATQLFREENYAAVSMRKIAKRIEYSVGTLYLYYKDKDELFLAVQERAFRQAFAHMQPALREAEPIDRLYALGRRYIEFALGNPDLYRLMFMMENPMQALDENENWKSGIKLHELLSTIVSDCLKAEQLPPGDPHQMSFMLWSMVHGMSSLKVSERLHIYTGEHLADCPLSGNTAEVIDRAYHQMMMLLSRVPLTAS